MIIRHLMTQRITPGLVSYGPWVWQRVTWCWDFCRFPCSELYPWYCTTVSQHRTTKDQHCLGNVADICIRGFHAHIILLVAQGSRSSLHRGHSGLIWSGICHYSSWGSTCIITMDCCYCSGRGTHQFLPNFAVFERPWRTTAPIYRFWTWPGPILFFIPNQFPSWSLWIPSHHQCISKAV